MDKIGQYNVMGINLENANNMRTAIEDYKAGLDEVLAKVTALDTDQYQVGFKGTQQVAKIKMYIDNSVAEMHKMSDFIDEFVTGLNLVINNYAAKTNATTTAEVKDATVEGAGDLAGVNKFGE